LNVDELNIDNQDNLNYDNYISKLIDIKEVGTGHKNTEFTLKETINDRDNKLKVNDKDHYD
jgi:hypothetical protein